MPEILSGDDPEAVHRARVASRRMQEDIAALFRKPYPKNVRKLRRLLKRARRDLGGWRNCDVVLALLKKKRNAGGEANRSAWKIAERYVKDERRRRIDEARRRLAARDFGGLAARLKKSLEGERCGIAPLQAGLKAARKDWGSALAAAEKSRSDENLHAFRITTKKLRYRLELGRELGLDSSPLLEGLKRLQRALGDWRDRELVDQMTAESIARPKILLSEFNAARTLLIELEKDSQQRSVVMEEILRAAGVCAGRMRQLKDAAL